MAHLVRMVAMAKMESLAHVDPLAVQESASPHTLLYLLAAVVAHRDPVAPPVPLDPPEHLETLEAVETPELPVGPAPLDVQARQDRLVPLVAPETPDVKDGKETMEHREEREHPDSRDPMDPGDLQDHLVHLAAAETADPEEVLEPKDHQDPPDLVAQLESLAGLDPQPKLDGMPTTAPARAAATKHFYGDFDDLNRTGFISAFTWFLLQQFSHKRNRSFCFNYWI